MHTGRPGMIERMRANGRTGWYFRVLQPGRVPVAGPLRVVERHPAGVSVLRAHLATVPGGMSDAERRAILRETPLAAAAPDPRPAGRGLTPGDGPLPGRGQLHEEGLDLERSDVEVQRVSLGAHRPRASSSRLTSVAPASGRQKRSAAGPLRLPYS